MKEYNNDQISFDEDYELDCDDLESDNWIEEAFREEIGKALAKAVDESIMRSLSRLVVHCNTFTFQNENQDKHYEDYDRAMSIIQR